MHYYPRSGKSDRDWLKLVQQVRVRQQPVDGNIFEGRFLTPGTATERAPVPGTMLIERCHRGRKRHHILWVYEQDQWVETLSVQTPSWALEIREHIIEMLKNKE